LQDSRSKLTIRRFAADEWRAYRDLRLESLAESPDAFGSTLAIERERSDEQWQARLGASPETNLPLVALVQNRAIGLAWGRIEASAPDTAHVYQMWVRPADRRLGAGKKLIDEVISWARSRGLRRLELTMTSGNTPALRLYQRAGFTPVGEPVPVREGSGLLAQPMELVLTQDREAPGFQT
jgi:ribosomal protein S18 acetylase RimI-like enzyme